MALLHIVLSALLMLIQFFGGHVATYFFRILAEKIIFHVTLSRSSQVLIFGFQ